ncbi:MAG TPA: glycosyltransferase family 2 protein [Chitinophagaceae bacterium]|nr:glycosyltransferase family 2 protein [Chitinophagaceae bacterium]
MKKAVSVVILCKNEEKIISSTLKSVKALTDDIVCADSGSTDNTKNIIEQWGAKLFEISWEGYGKTKNKAIDKAQYDWILALDSDEPIDAELLQSILAEPFDDVNTVYSFSFQTYFCNKRIRFGEWGRKEKHIRLFNRTVVRWQEVDVHEQLNLPPGFKIKHLDGAVQHHTVKNYESYIQKNISYALLGGQKYYQQGKNVSLLKIWIAPLFSFGYNYFFRLGFLDGWEGFLIARTTAIYTFIKYAHLRELKNQLKKRTQ